MSQGTLIGLFGALALLGAPVVTWLLARRADKRDDALRAQQQAEVDALRAQEKAKADAATSEVSWEAINRVLVAERNAMQVKLDRQAEDHRTEIREMKADADRKAAELRDLYEKDLRAANARIKELESTSLGLHQELREANRKLTELQSKSRDR